MRNTLENSNAKYSNVPDGYFSGARKAFIDDMPVNPDARLLEIGCGTGDTAAYALSTGKCGWCAGVELCTAPAVEAASRLNDVQIGDVENLVLPYSKEYFDVMIMSEVIEHFVDPWATLKRLRLHLKVGALVVAGSPNVAHWGVLNMLFRGRWDYTSAGIMDRTHLRWFTPVTYRELFEDAGFNVTWCGPATPLTSKALWFNRLTGGRFEHLLTTQIHLKAIRA